MAGNSAIGFERAQLELVEVNHFAAAAITAFDQHSSHGLERIRGLRKFDAPEVHRRIGQLDAVEIAFLLAAKLAYNSHLALPVRLGGRPALETDLLLGSEFPLEDDDRTGAVNQKRPGGFFEFLALAINT